MHFNVPHFNCRPCLCILSTAWKLGNLVNRTHHPFLAKESIDCVIFSKLTAAFSFFLFTFYPCSHFRVVFWGNFDCEGKGGEKRKWKEKKNWTWCQFIALAHRLNWTNQCSIIDSLHTWQKYLYLKVSVPFNLSRMTSAAAKYRLRHLDCVYSIWYYYWYLSSNSTWCILFAEYHVDKTIRIYLC